MGKRFEDVHGLVGLEVFLYEPRGTSSYVHITKTRLLSCSPKGTVVELENGRRIDLRKTAQQIAPATNPEIARAYADQERDREQRQSDAAYMQKRIEKEKALILPFLQSQTLDLSTWTKIHGLLVVWGIDDYAKEENG